MQIAVVGAGAVGCYYGGLLLRAGHDVTFSPAAASTPSRPWPAARHQDFQRHLPGQGRTDATALASPDLVLVCVKSADTEQAGRYIAGPLAAGNIRPQPADGVDNAPRLAAVTGHAVIPVVVYVGSEMAGPGHVRHHGGGDLAIAPRRERSAGANAASRRQSASRSPTT